MISLYAALCAERVAFNSDYNCRTFLKGVAKLPEHVPASIGPLLAERGSVLPVPLDNSWSQLPSQRGSHFTLLWNHRWKYDKAPERLFASLSHLREKGADFQAHIVGQRFRKTLPVFNEIREAFEGSIGAWGFIEDETEYCRLMRQSHVVLSTSQHDFQGLSILEATAAGCMTRGVFPMHGCFLTAVEQQAGRLSCDGRVTRFVKQIKKRPRESRP